MLLLSILVIIVLTIVMEKSNECKKINKRVCLISLISVLLINLGVQDVESLILGKSLLNSLLYMDSINSYMMFLILFVGIVYMLLLSCNISSIKVIDNLIQVKESIGLLILFNILGLVLLILVNDLMVLFVVIELQSYSLYLITSAYNSSSNSIKSGLYYFIVGSIGSFIILDGTVSIYEEIGLTNIELITLCINYINMYDILIILFGLFIKVGLAPFYSYSIVIYSLAPTIITYYISLMPKLSILTLILSLVGIINLVHSDISSNIINIISFIILLSMIIGSIGGVNVIRIKTLLAYSSLLNVSYMLLAIIGSNGYSYIGYLFYILQYSITHINTFSIILLLPVYTNINLLTGDSIKGTGKNEVMLSKYSPVEYISQLRVLLNKNSWLAIALVISFFSLIGIPPLSGFYGKLLVFISALGNGYIFLSILLVIASSISAYYYGSVIKEICFDILNNYNVFNYKNLTIMKKDMLGKLETSFEELKSSVNDNGNNVLYMNNNITYTISLMTLIIVLVLFEYENIIRGTFIVTLNMI